MEIKGRIKSIEPCFFPGQANILLHVENADLEQLQSFKHDVRVSLVEWREKRSLNANAYFHALSDKLADATRMSKPECKNYLLYTYGQKWRDENGQLICIKTNAPRKDVMENKDFHAWDMKPSADGIPMYCLLRHSSSFDSREMSILIDGVIEECKTYHIETMTPRELAELKARWGEENG